MADEKHPNWPAEVELVIDVCDDPPRPFLASELDQGARGDYDWREVGDYLTRVYVPGDRLDTLLAGLKAEVDGLRASVKASEEENVGSSSPEYEARMHEQNMIRKALADRLEHRIKQAGGEA